MNLNHQSIRPGRTYTVSLGYHPPPAEGRIYWDTETYPISQGRLAPPLVCLAWCADDGPVHLLDAADARRWWGEVLATRCTLVAHNAAFDLGVMAAECGGMGAIWDLVASGRSRCTAIREKLRNIACVPFTVAADLGSCVRLRWGWAVSGKKQGEGEEDPWRVRYNELAEVPLDRWPESAIHYAAADAAWVRLLYRDQERPLQVRYVEGSRTHTAQLIGGGDDELAQTRAAWAFHITGAWGLRADADRTDDANRAAAAHITELRAALVDLGIYRDTGKLDTAALRAHVEAEWRGGPIPRTEKGATSTAKDTLQRLGGPVADALLELREADKTAQFLGVAALGGRYPVCASYNPLVATGRSSCRNPNLQQLPRKGGVRECFIPRPGRVYLWVDYDSLELRTWAQVTADLFGLRRSTLAARYRDDPAFDPHTALAGSLLGLSYAEAMRRKEAGDPDVKSARGMGKVGNFGLCGGMSWRSLRDYARMSYGIRLTDTQAQEIRSGWLRTWAEAGPYLDYISEQVAYADDAQVCPYGGWTLRQQRSGRLRAGCSYTNGANTLFQGRAADGAKAALVEVTRRCLHAPSSALYGARPVWFVHDEIGLEVDAPRASRAADELIEVMQDEMQAWLPDVPVRASATLASRWSKKAESTKEDGTWTVWHEGQ